MKLMVLDGNSIINRAFYGVKPLTTRDGLYTNAIFGFLNMLQRFVDEEQPEALCVAFDRKEPTFRHEADANYKATRKGMPEELAQQMPVMKQVLCAMSIPCYEMVGYEADDLLGTISRRCEKRGWECVIVTGDRDSLQLITDRTRVKLVTSRMGQTSTTDMTPALFREQYGFDPIHMIDLKALMGDSSDNIPGVPGIGEKTATALVQRYGSIDALYAAMPDVEAKPAALRKLAEGEESARRSYWLATIVTDAPLEFDPEDALRQPYRPELYDLFMKLEFTKLIKKYDLTPAAPTPEPAAPVHDEDYSVMIEVPQTDDDAARLLAQWRSVPHVTVYGLDDLRALAVECEIDDHHGLTVILRTDRFDGDWDALLRGLFSADIPKVAHNVKDMTYALLERGLPAEGFIFDTALAAYLLDATAGGYDLQRLFVAYCGAELPAPAHLARDAFAPLSDAATEEAALCSYTSAVSALYEILPGKLEELNLTALLHEMELPLCRVLAEMELAGFRIDECALAQFGIDLHERIVKLEQSIYDMAGDEAMQQAFLSGADFHTVTAAKVFHVPEAEVTHEMRSRAKAVNFGIVYGMSAFSLSQDIHVTVAEAKDYMERYFATYPGVKQYMTDIVALAKEQGYVETLYHRRRALPEIRSSNFIQRSFGERVALNMPIQGTAADVMKLAMIRVYDRLRRENLQAKLIMQVHDELIVECPEAERETVETLLRQEMEQVAALSVPLIAEAHSGKNWLEAKG